VLRARTRLGGSWSEEVEHFAGVGPCNWYEELDLALADEVGLDL
jgi:hypothetical protein